MGTYVDTKAVDIINHQMFKSSLLNRLRKYEKSRTGIISYFFRDKALIEKKKTLVSRLIESIINLFDNAFTFEALEKTVKEAITENARISSESEKFHYNLSENRPLIYRDNDCCFFLGEVDLREGEEPNQSKLANVLHNSLDDIEAYKSKVTLK